MKHRLMIIAAATLFVGSMTGCVLTVEESHHHHPDRCYDCHSSWELDRVAIGVHCTEFEIIVVSGGYWYKPVGASDTERRFHLLKAAEPKTILGPVAPAGS